MAASDAELVALVRRGNIEAFGLLAQRYEKTLLAAAIAHVGDLHTAEDVVQAALLRAFERLDSLRDPERFGAWLLQVARRQALDAMRPRPIPALLHADDRESRSSTEASCADVWIEHEHLLNTVAGLPDGERTLIGLRYFDGHSMAEIAAITGRPLGSVTKQISRILARLRFQWEEDSDP
jgi:RNA polymerase sigma-70 factor (ECF subfamily)